MSKLVSELKAFIHDRFSLSKDKAREGDIIESIKKGVEFRGVNVWILIFAIFIASIGLDVNSVAMIIGAMLISPLMGPIMGLGLGVGIFDFGLIKKSAKNLAVMVGVSVVASTTYFLISPFDEAKSELLARTMPTVWDVFIAIFGGLAGIIASASKERGNVIPGVAIATALMPPLCTAGYGLSEGDPAFFFGASYLFSINTVFISVATVVVVRFLKFKQVTFVDEATEKRIKGYVMLIVVVTVLPSIYLAYLIINKTIEQQNAKAFVLTELNMQNTRLLNYNLEYSRDSCALEVFLIGEPLDDTTIFMLQEKMAAYRLENCGLVVRQGVNGPQELNMSEIKTGLIEDLFKRNESLLRLKEKELDSIKKSRAEEKEMALPLKDITRELEAQHPDVNFFTIQPAVVYNAKTKTFDSMHIAVTGFRKKPKVAEINRLRYWLKIRTHSDSLFLLVK